MGDPGDRPPAPVDVRADAPHGRFGKKRNGCLRSPQTTLWRTADELPLPLVRQTGGDRQLGDGSASNQGTPILVSGGYSWSTLSAGGYHTCGGATAGEAYCWGLGSSGELGDGLNSRSITPLLVQKP